MNPIINLGVQRTLEFSDLMRLSEKDKSKNLIKKITNAYSKCKKFVIFPRIIMALWRAHLWDTIACGVYAVAEGATRVAQPVFLALLLKELQDLGSPIWKAYMWGSIMCAATVLQIIVHHNSFLIAYRTGWYFKNSATALIYDHLLKTKTSDLDSAGMTTGKLVNLISNDVSRYDEFIVYQHFSWEAILELGTILVLISYILNLNSALAGIGVTVFFIPIQVHLAKLFASVRGKTAGQTDKRIRQISETIDGIGSVKAYGWEVPFYNLIGELRDAECINIQKSQLLRSFNLSLYFCIPPLASFASFVVYWSSGQTLTLPKIFSTMSLLQGLRQVVGRMWTRAMETGSEAIASSTRIDQFLSLQRNNSNGDKNNGNNNSGGNSKVVGSIVSDAIPASGDASLDLLVRVSTSSYAYPKMSSPVLRDVELSVARGELLVVVGSVGAGKSSLLSVLLGEISRCDSTESAISMHDTVRIAYCAQRAWIIANSVRTNVLMAGEESQDASNSELYKLAISSSRLQEDLDAWPSSDLTEIGERGVSISGGQRARVSLARAVYSDADCE